MADWIELNLPYGGYDLIEGKGFVRKDSLTKRGLANPGTLIEIATGDVYLIGHINPLRGVCDDCVEFYDDMIVKRYKVVWREE